MPQTKEPAEMTVLQAAELFGVNVKSVRDWIHANKFPGARKIGEGRTSAWLIPTDEILAFKKERDQAKSTT